MKLKIGSSYDVHRLDKGEYILLGGVKIPCDFSTVAHSDGDVIYHALAESILGGLALGDLGTYFPPNSTKTKDMNSFEILSFALKEMEKRNFKVNNVDISLILQRPKIKTYIPQIREKLARELNVDEDCVSVKAGTNEKLDDLGKGLGIGCFATILLIQE